MKNFSRSAQRTLMEGDTGYKIDLSMDFTEAQNQAALGPAGEYILATAIGCLLVGLDGPARELLEKSLHCASTAIKLNEKPERYFPGATEAFRFEAVAMSHWLMRGVHHNASWDAAITNRLRYHYDAEPGSDSVGISLAVPMFLAAEAYDAVLSLPNSVPGMESRIHTEAGMACVVARHRVSLEKNPEELRKLSNRFLKRMMNRWLCNGHYLRAAEWMKALHWEPGMPAKDALLKCYDYLPAAARE
jgi:hypothetical protein